MKCCGLLLILSASAWAFSNEQAITGNIESVNGCSKKVMVWLSLDKDSYKDRLLLMHTEVPVGGTYKFNVKPGAYQVRGSDEAGCEFLKRVNVSGTDEMVPIKMVKK